MLCFSSPAWKVLVQTMWNCGWNVQFQKISIPTTRKVNENSKGRGSQKQKNLKESKKLNQNIQRGQEPKTNAPISVKPLGCAASLGKLTL